MSELNPVSRGFVGITNVVIDIIKGVAQEGATKAGIIEAGNITKVDNIPKFVMDNLKATMPLAKAVNTPDAASSGWQRQDPEQLKSRFPELSDAVFSDPQTGFGAALFKADDGSFVLAYENTQEMVDWGQNVLQGVGMTGKESQATSQYQQAMDLATQVKAVVGDELVLTGHSLGGGLASAAAIASSTPAYVYNGAGLSKETQKIIGEELVDQNFHQVVNVNDTRDFLNNLNGNMQHTTLGGESIGSIYWIDHSHKQNPSLNVVENHGMENMAEVLGIDLTIK